MDAAELFAGRAKPSGTWTTLADWREDDTSLVARATPEAGADAVRILAYGLQHLGTRRLELALPPKAARITRFRAAFLNANIVVHEDRHGRLTTTEPVDSAEAVAWYGRLGPVRPLKDPQDFDGPTWLRDLVDWVESRRVERMRRAYWAWHYRGRQVLKVSVKRSGEVTLTAGVNYSRPTGDQPKPFVKSWSRDESPSTTEIRMIREAVDLAIERRRVGLDDTHREHIMQAALGTEPGLLGLTHLYREFPAWRPAVAKAASSYIDFVGVDLHGGLHVVETKIGHDPMLGLQGLDYWAWVQAHQDAAARRLDPADEGALDVQLHVVLGCSPKGLIHPAARATLERLDTRVVPWQCHVIDDWDSTARTALLTRPQPVPRIPAATVPPDGVCHETTP